MAGNKTDGNKKETKQTVTNKRTSDKVIVDRKASEDKKEKAGENAAPKDGKTKLISILAAVVLAQLPGKGKVERFVKGRLSFR